LVGSKTAFFLDLADSTLNTTINEKKRKLNNCENNIDFWKAWQLPEAVVGYLVVGNNHIHIKQLEASVVQVND
jgi:hypothetical protein